MTLDVLPTLGLCVLVFVASAAIDYAHARYVQALTGGHRHRAARWSVAQWCAATVGFVVAVKVSLVVLPFEAAGLYLGTTMAVPRTRAPMRVVRIAGNAKRRSPVTPG